MAITQAFCTSAKQEFLQGTHVIGTDVLKIALYSSAANLGADTTAYTATGEITGTGYTAGGNTLTGAAVTVSGTGAIVDFADSTWAAATFTARGALIYNSSKANRAIAVLDFGADRSASGTPFVVVFPTPDLANAILRIL